MLASRYWKSASVDALSSPETARADWLVRTVAETTQPSSLTYSLVPATFSLPGFHPGTSRSPSESRTGTPAARVPPAAKGMSCAATAAASWPGVMVGVARVGVAGAALWCGRVRHADAAAGQRGRDGERQECAASPRARRARGGGGNRGSVPAVALTPVSCLLPMPRPQCRHAGSASRPGPRTILDSRRKHPGRRLPPVLLPPVPGRPRLSQDPHRPGNHLDGEGQRADPLPVRIGHHESADSSTLRTRRMCTAGCPRWPPEKTFGKTFSRPGRDSGPTMKRSRQPSSSTASGVTFMPPPIDWPLATEISIAPCRQRSPSAVTV